MNYPVWELTTFAGGTLIAVIATVHVFVSHFAVGGGLFLVLTEMKAYREKEAENDNGGQNPVQYPSIDILQFRPGVSLFFFRHHYSPPNWDLSYQKMVRSPKMTVPMATPR